ncbi:MAG: hypothetical protein KGO51_01640 [Alphaproteobacteria bacterium]|nr:hypothetical protein [Alphaproteobacteria bacterium]
MLNRRAFARLTAGAALSPRLALAAPAPATAFVDRLPAYRPAAQVSGLVRLWGHGSPTHDFLGDLVKVWMAGFQRRQPGVRFGYQLYGTASAVGALYTGAGDIAILGEEISPDAVRAFTRARGYAPTDISIATGSVDVDFFDYAHMIFVHRDNPLTRLSVPQLEGIFGEDHRLRPRNLRLWGDLGLAGDWAERPIHPYGWKVDEDFGLFFRERVLGGSHRWNPAITEFSTSTSADGRKSDRGQKIVDAVGADRFGVGISNVRFKNRDVKPLALSWKDGGPACMATPETLISQAYPLVRIIPAIVDRAPGRPLAPPVRELLRYILSREGQQALIDASRYLPLGEAARARQLERLA